MTGESVLAGPHIQMPDHLNLPWGKRKKHAKLLQLDKGESLQPWEKE